ncbi:MAG TPA: NAD(P)/FAD-dependent oxidoreductase [Candidatus Saccharimonadales bacterium]|nr:NAD(P)/FAD-dependent oxidoreductase [Candidatus Saccharimonadales bacterium]
MPHRYDYDLIVIGSGAAGSVAAHIGASTGKRVAIVEAKTFGGDCPNYADIPIKAMLHVANLYDETMRATRFGIRSSTIGYNYPSIRGWKETAIHRTGSAQSKQSFEREGINVLKGAAHFVSDHEVSIGRRHYSAESFYIATGADTLLPAIKGLDDVRYLTTHNALNLLRPPKSLFVIGAGGSGCEFAHLFSVFGSKITMADIASRLLPREDEQVSQFVQNHFAKYRRIQMLPGTKITHIEKEAVLKRVHLTEGANARSVKVDEILLATGKAPRVDMGLENAGVEYTAKGITVNEFMQTTAKHIFAGGDVVGPHMYTHAAIYQSRVAMHNLFHRQKMAADYRAVPRVYFLEPEIAAVGITEEDAVKYAIKYRTATTPISIIARANISDEGEGFVKVITSPEGKLLGASIASPHAGEMIHELSVAIQAGLTAQDVANTIHAFPTWSEAVRAACSKVTT